MPNKEPDPTYEGRFRSIEAEFHGRLDHQASETTPSLITMPSELEFAQLAAVRETRESAEKEKRAADHKEWFKKEKLKRRKSRLKKAVAATAIFVTYQSGGLIDKAGDPLVDAGDVVASALEKPKVEIPDERDGIEFEDYSEDVQTEMLADEEERVEKQGGVRDALIDLFSELDSNGPDVLLQEVEKYKEAHSEQFVSQEVIAVTKEQIDNAKSNDETISALNEFMSNEYEITADYHSASFEDNGTAVKDFAKASVEVFGALPKDFVALSELERLLMSDKESSDAGNYVDNEIKLFTKGPIGNTAVNLLGNVAYVGDAGHEWVVAHELGHAFSEHLILPVTGTDIEADGINPLDVLEHVGRELIQRPEFPSFYAETEGEEHTAEVLAGLFSRSDDGLAEVNEWRRFGSESNKNMIRLLAQLEETYPGIAKILVANRLK